MYNFSERLDLVDEMIYNFASVVKGRRGRGDGSVESFKRKLNNFKKREQELNKTRKEMDTLKRMHEFKDPKIANRKEDLIQKAVDYKERTTPKLSLLDKIKNLPTNLKDKLKNMSPKTKKTAIIVSAVSAVTFGSIVTALILKKKAGKQKLVDEIMRKQGDPKKLVNALKSLKSKCQSEEDAESTINRIDYMIDELSNTNNYESCLKKLLDSDSSTVILLAVSK